MAVQTQNRIVVAFGRTTPFCWLFTLAVLVILGWLSFWIGAKFDHPLLAVLAYLWVIWQIVSKVSRAQLTLRFEHPDQVLLAIQQIKCDELH